MPNQEVISLKPTNLKETTDEQLLSFIREPMTHEKGFRLLVERYQEPLYRHIRRLVLDHDDADDVLQNTFVKVFRNIDRFEGKSKLFTWLYRIATNEAISFLSQRNRKNTDTLDSADATHVANSLKADVFLMATILTFAFSKHLRFCPINNAPFLICAITTKCLMKKCRRCWILRSARLKHLIIMPLKKLKRFLQAQRFEVDV